MTLSNSPSQTKATPNKIKGKTQAKHTMVVALIARGFSVKEVARKVKLSESQIYHLLADEDSHVNTEIRLIVSKLFAENDRHLINLYTKALRKLDELLSGSDEEKKFRAIDRIIKLFATRSGKNDLTIQQYFGIQSQDPKDPKESFDDIINRKRKERGLPPWPDGGSQQVPELAVHKEQEPPHLPDSKDSSNPSPNGSSSDDSFASSKRDFLESLKTDSSG